jgi:AraC-like DNA-binding protein
MAVAPETVLAITEGLTRLGLDVSRLKIGSVKDDESLHQLWKAAIARSGRGTLPLEVGLSMPLGAMGLLDYLAASSATVGAALHIAQQFFSLVAPGVQLMLTKKKAGRFQITIVNQPPFPGEFESDSLVVGILVARLRQIASKAIDDLKIDFTNTTPQNKKIWVHLLPSCKLCFGARRTSLYLNSRDWKLPLRHPDPRLQRTLRRALGSHAPSSDALLVALRAIIRQALPVSPRIESVASMLGLSGRNLQRKLKVTRTSFARQVDEQRRLLAEELIGESFSMNEIARRIGFHEQASFTRAWRRWHRKPPSKSRLRSDE